MGPRHQSFKRRRKFRAAKKLINFIITAPLTQGGGEGGLGSSQEADITKSIVA